MSKTRKTNPVLQRNGEKISFVLTIKGLQTHVLKIYKTKLQPSEYQFINLLG